jgi:peptidoglycan/xylan/chitin deacetylase (PgdA/CDA1 family)
VLEGAAVSSGFLRLASRRRRGRTIVLAYHNVVEPAAGSCADRSLHIPLQRFCAHLEAIQRCCDVVPVGELTTESEPRRPRVAITFDDAYRGTVRLGLAELRRRGLASTVFVPPGFIPDATFWWDDLARRGGLNDASRSAALNEGRGRDAEIRRLWTGAGESAAPPVPDDERCCTIEELRAATESGAVSLGSHTWSHPNLTRASPDELADELNRPLAWLRRHFPEACVPAISYPYGLVSETVCVAAGHAGYSLGFRVSGGWIPKQIGDRLTLPRLNVPAGLSANGLALRLAGLLAE